MFMFTTFRYSTTILGHLFAYPQLNLSLQPDISEITLSQQSLRLTLLSNGDSTWIQFLTVVEIPIPVQLHISKTGAV